MQKNSKATTHDEAVTLQELAHYANERFRAGRGAEFIVHKRGHQLRLLMIPTPLFSDTARLGLAIACEGEGTHVWDGQRPLHPFSLVRDGFQLPMATEVATLVAAIFPFRVRRKLTGPVQDQQTTGQKPKTKKARKKHGNK